MKTDFLFHHYSIGSSCQLQERRGRKGAKKGGRTADREWVGVRVGGESEGRRGGRNSVHCSAMTPCVICEGQVSMSEPKSGAGAELAGLESWLKSHKGNSGRVHVLLSGFRSCRRMFNRIDLN